MDEPGEDNKVQQEQEKCDWVFTLSLNNGVHRYTSRTVEEKVVDPPERRDSNGKSPGGRRFEISSKDLERGGGTGVPIVKRLNDVSVSLRYRERSICSYMVSSAPKMDKVLSTSMYHLYPTRSEPHNPRHMRDMDQLNTHLLDIGGHIVVFDIVDPQSLLYVTLERTKRTGLEVKEIRFMANEQDVSSVLKVVEPE